MQRMAHKHPGLRLRPALAGLALAAALAGCQSNAPRPDPAPETSASPAASSGFGAALNSYRRANGRSALAQDARLSAAAQAQLAYFQSRGGSGSAHRGPGGNSVGDRVKARGVRACMSAENFASGATSAEAVIAQWAGSPGHRANMLRQGLDSYGYARSGNEWILVLADQC